MKLFEIKNAKKSFGKIEVLKDISFSIEKGEVISIIGPSGSGKSTLLRCASFLEHLDQGEIYFNGALITPEKEKEMYNHIGFVFQDYQLFPHFSVLKNIMDAPIRNQKRDKNEILIEAKELLNKVGLSDKENAYPSMLSGGQAQRIAIARALALKPDLLFFDEPTSALDPEMTKEILNVIKDLTKKHMTMIIVTHEMEFARAVSDKIIFMENGYIVEEGTSDDLFHSENRRTQAFIGKK